MKVKIVSDVAVQVVEEGEYFGKFIFAPSSLRRDVVMEFTPPVKPLLSNSLTGLHEMVGNGKFHAEVGSGRV